MEVFLRRSLVRLTVAWFVLAVSASSGATTFGSLKGVVHDPQHRPVPGVTVSLTARSSEWRQATVSDGAGEFSFVAVPVGEYLVQATLQGFETAQQTVTVLCCRTARRSFICSCGLWVSLPTSPCRPVPRRCCPPRRAP